MNTLSRAALAVSDLQVEPISANGCGVIATVIPVLLLAGLFDAQYLKSSAWRSKYKVLQWLLVISGIIAAIMVMLGLGFACVGAAGDGFDRDEGTEISTIWVSLALSGGYMITRVATRLIPDTHGERKAKIEMSLESADRKTLTELHASNEALVIELRAFKDALRESRQFTRKRTSVVGRLLRKITRDLSR